MVPFIEDKQWDRNQVQVYKDELLNKLPFYKGLVYSENYKTIQTAVYLKKEIVNSKERKTLFSRNYNL